MESNYKKRLVSEMIYIKSNYNSINKKEAIQNLSAMYFPIINDFNTCITLSCKHCRVYIYIYIYIYSMLVIVLQSRITSDRRM